MDLEKIIEKLATSGVESLTQEEKESLRNMVPKNGIHQFLSKISIEEIVNKNEEFHALNVKKLSDEKLFNALMDTITFDVDDLGNKMSFLMPMTVSYPISTRFYRIRKLAEGDNCVPLKTISVEQDAWNAPEKYCDLGRLNKDGESLLYTSVQSPNVSVEEMEIKDGERFGLIVYEANRDIKATLIDRWQDNSALSKEENLKMRMSEKYF